MSSQNNLMTMNTQNEIEYIKLKYIQMGILNKDGTKKIREIDYNIYPWEKGYIPKCSECSEMYNKYKIAPISHIHTLRDKCHCLWFDWFKTKLLQNK